MKVIAFSGGCLSGKSTAIEILKSYLEAEGNKVILFDELMREQDILSIDDIRKSPSMYLRTQKSIIEGKIMQELGLDHYVLMQNINNIKEHKEQEDYYVLINRAISDSLFYLLFYVDKSTLTTEDLEIYDELYRFADISAKMIFDRVYDLVITFKPITFKVLSDKFRPEKINVLKNIESRFIESLTLQYLTTDNRYLVVDMNEYKNEPEKIIDLIYNALWHE